MKDWELHGLRESRGAPTEYTAPDKGEKTKACYAVGSLRWKDVISSEQAASVMAVLIWLIKHASPKNGRCDPSLGKLAFETGLGVATIKRALKVAEDSGYLRIEERIGETSAYHVNFKTMVADFLDIERQAKKLPRGQGELPTQLSAELPTQLTGELLNRKGESVNGKRIPLKGCTPPSADCTRGDESKNGYQGRTEWVTEITLPPANPKLVTRPPANQHRNSQQEV